MWSFGTTFTMASEKDAAKPSPANPQTQNAPTSGAAVGSTAAPTATVTQHQTTDSAQEARPPAFLRPVKQLGLFFAGASFLALSTLITRRAIVRKRLATVPKFYSQSNVQPSALGSDSSLIALEALNLATLNTVGFGIMATGGLAWAFDICNVDELRARARRHTRGTGSLDGGQTDEEAERQVEEWVAKVLSRTGHDFKGKGEDDESESSSKE